MNNIKTKSCTLGELFSKSLDEITGQLTIPEYQRPYLWGETEINKLLQDMYEYFVVKDDSKPNYYLGNFVLHQNNGLLNVIDGQQRITTLCIMLVLLESDILPELQFSSPVSTNNIQRNYKYLLSKKSQLSKIGITKLLDETNVILVVTDNEDDAYTFFETQNTGGVRLNGVDIIKAHHLRAIETEGMRSEYAVRWESESSDKIYSIVLLLIKARYWSILNWQNMPSTRPNKKYSEDVKRIIIKVFSEDTGKRSKDDVTYLQIRAKKDESGKYNALSPFIHKAIRQPLNDGINFMEYLFAFCELYEQLFVTSKIQDNQYQSFYNKIIAPEDGTLYLKQLYQIAMLCYVQRFGFDNIYEAALWIFRCTYSLRLSSEKTVKEDSIPAFLQKTYWIIDQILNAFNHDEIITQLKQFDYKVDTTIHSAHKSGGVKGRYIKRLSDFGIYCEVRGDIDTHLKKYINTI